MWNIGPAQLPGLGQTWSHTRHRARSMWSRRVAEQQRAEVRADLRRRLRQSAGDAHQHVRKRQAIAMFMVDAQTGKRLWYAGSSSTRAWTCSFAQDDQRHSRAASRCIDTNSDGFADRMYAGDMGGRIWRFDIFNGNHAGSLVTGGVIAQLGRGDVAGATHAGQPPLLQCAGRLADPEPRRRPVLQHRDRLGLSRSSARSVRHRPFLFGSRQGAVRPLDARRCTTSPFRVLDANLTDITANPRRYRGSDRRARLEASLTSHGHRGEGPGRVHHGEQHRAVQLVPAGGSGSVEPVSAHQPEPSVCADNRLRLAGAGLQR